MKTRTKRITYVAAAVTLLALAAWAQTAFQYSVQSMPPSVIKTVPAAGSTDVDPNLKEITATFSKDMIDGNWSICQVNKDNFPEDAGNGAKIHYLPDKRTVVFPVRLQPGHTYVLWYNLGKYTAFRDTNGKSSVPYLLVFQTKP